MNKIKIQFAGINSNGNPCYKTEKGSFIAKIGEDFYSLNQAPDYGLIGIEGEPDAKLKKEYLEIYY